MPTSAPWSLPSGHLRKRPGGLTMLGFRTVEYHANRPRPVPDGPGPGGAGDGLGSRTRWYRARYCVRTRSRITFLQFFWSTPMVGTKLRRPIISHSKVSSDRDICHLHRAIHTPSASRALAPQGSARLTALHPTAQFHRVVPWSRLALLCPSPANHRIMYSGATMPRSDAPRGAANHALPLRPSAPCPLSRRRPSR
jgi:hypothetical protein